MKTIGIYPGQFQPPHLGHKRAYLKLKQYANPDTFVVTTDFDPSVEAPLHFGDKEQILVRHGIPASHIKRVKDLRNPVEVLENFDSETTVVIYALNKIDAIHKLNESNYYKSFVSAGTRLQPYKNQAYIFTVDDNIKSKDKEGKEKIYTSQTIREALGSQRFTRKQKELFFKQFFGWFDLGLFELLQEKYSNAFRSDSFDDEDELSPEKILPPEEVKEILSREIISILNELMSSPPSIATDGSFGPDSIATDKTSNQDADTGPTIDQLVDKKRETERDLDSLQKDLKWKQSDIMRKRKDELPNKRKEIDSINKQITQVKQSDL